MMKTGHEEKSGNLLKVTQLESGPVGTQTQANDWLQYLCSSRLCDTATHVFSRIAQKMAVKVFVRIQLVYYNNFLTEIPFKRNTCLFKFADLTLCSTDGHPLIAFTRLLIEPGGLWGYPSPGHLRKFQALTAPSPLTWHG